MRESDREGRLVQSHYFVFNHHSTDSPQPNKFVANNNHDAHDLNIECEWEVTNDRRVFSASRNLLNISTSSVEFPSCFPHSSRPQQIDQSPQNQTVAFVTQHPRSNFQHQLPPSKTLRMLFQKSLLFVLTAFMGLTIAAPVPQDAGESP